MVMNIFVAAVLASLAAMFWFSLNTPTVAGKPSQAVISHFRPNLSRFHPEAITVTARTPNGISGTDVISADALEEHHCRIGDRVTGEVDGIRLKFDASTCRPR